MNRLVITLFVITCSIKGFSQKVVFDLNANMVYPLDFEDRSMRVDTAMATSIYFYPSDTIAIKRTYLVSYETSRKYESHMGFELNGLFTIPISRKFNFSTGIGVSYFSYVLDENFIGHTLDTLSIDTVPPPSFIGNPITPIGTSCDCYENSFLDLIDSYDRRPKHQQLSLLIPARFEYQVWNGRLGINFGAFAQVPVFASVKREFITIEETEVDTMTKCKYVIDENVNNSGDGIKNFQAGISAGIKIGILNNLSLEIGARKLLTNVYVDQKYQTVFFSNFSAKDYRPIYMTAGVTYSFHQVEE